MVSFRILDAQRFDTPFCAPTFNILDKTMKGIKVGKQAGEGGDEQN